MPAFSLVTNPTAIAEVNRDPSLWARYANVLEADDEEAAVLAAARSLGAPAVSGDKIKVIVATPAGVRTYTVGYRAPAIFEIREYSGPATDRDRELAHLGRCLALARAYAQLSQEAAAQQLRVSRKTVSLWETGVHEPGARDLLRLAEICGVSLDALCGRAGLPPVPCANEQG